MSIQQIPVEIKSGTKLFKGIYLTDVYIAGGYIAFTYLFQALVAPALQALYLIFNIFVGVFLAMGSRTNPGHRNIEAFIIYGLQDMRVYHSEGRVLEEVGYLK